MGLGALSGHFGMVAGALCRVLLSPLRCWGEVGLVFRDTPEKKKTHKNQS